MCDDVLTRQATDIIPAKPRTNREFCSQKLFILSQIEVLTMRPYDVVTQSKMPAKICVHGHLINNAESHHIYYRLMHIFVGLARTIHI